MIASFVCCGCLLCFLPSEARISFKSIHKTSHYGDEGGHLAILTVEDLKGGYCKYILYIINIYYAQGD